MNVCFSELHFIRLRGEEVPFCILIDRATIVALKQHEKTKKLVITSDSGRHGVCWKRGRLIRLKKAGNP
jgi:hypothetical protein